MPHRSLLTIVATSLALGSVALPAAAQEPEQREVIFAKMPSQYRAYGPPGGYYPDRAASLNINGFSIIECRVLPEGILEACVGVSDTPTGYGFTDSALRMAKAHVIAAAGEPTQGMDTVRLRVPFKLREKQRGSAMMSR